MKLFGSPSAKKKADKLAAACVAGLLYTCTAIGAIWLLGAVLHAAFAALGVA